MNHRIGRTVALTEFSCFGHVNGIVVLILFCFVVYVLYPRFVDRLFYAVFNTVYIVVCWQVQLTSCALL